MATGLILEGGYATTLGQVGYQRAPTVFHMASGHTLRGAIVSTLSRCQSRHVVLHERELQCIAALREGPVQYVLRAIGRSRTPKGGTGGTANVDGLPSFLQADPEGGSSMTFREFIEQSLADFEEHLRREAASPATDMRLWGARPNSPCCCSASRMVRTSGAARTSRSAMGTQLPVVSAGRNDA